MIKNKIMKLITKKTPLKKRQIPSFICGLTIAGVISLSSCGGDSGESYVEETVISEYTQGVITEVEEVEKDLFKITDETVAPTKEDSRIIARYMDGGIDTFTLDEVSLVDAEGEDSGKRSAIGNVIRGGLLGYFLGRSFSSPTNASAYKSPAAHAKSQSTTANSLRSSAKTSTVRRPVSGKSGYGGKGGSSRSTRSFGG